MNPASTYRPKTKKINPDKPWSQREENGFTVWPKSISLISLMPIAEMAPGSTKIKSAKSRLMFRKPLYFSFPLLSSGKNILSREENVVT
jgi:hypothetical protein